MGSHEMIVASARERPAAIDPHGQKRFRGNHLVCLADAHRLGGNRHSGRVWRGLPRGQGTTDDEHSHHDDRE